MKIRYLLILCLCLIVLTACGQPDPREEAEAEGIRTENRLKEQNEQIKLSKKEIWVEVLRSWQDDIVAMGENAIWWASIALCISLTAAILATGGGYCYAAYKGGKAAANAAEIRAMQFKPDRKTKMWPGFVMDGQLCLPGLNMVMDPKQQLEGPSPETMLAVYARLGEAGIFADAASEIAHQARNADPARDLPGVAASIPVLFLGQNEKE